MLSFSDSPQNLLNRLGKIGALVKNFTAHQAAQLTAMIDTVSGVTAQFNSESDIQAMMGSSYQTQLNSIGNLGFLCQQMAVATVNRAVYRDLPRPTQTLMQGNTIESLYEIIRQMKVLGATFRTCTVTAVATRFKNWDNNNLNTDKGIIVTSTIRPFDGRTLENSFSETVLVTVIEDSETGNAVEGNESISVRGPGSQDNVFAFDWPLGSNCSIGINAIDGDGDNTRGNLLTNSSFEEFTSNVPDNWTLVAGTAGTHIFEEDTLVYEGPPNRAIRFVGDGSTQTQIRQIFNVSSGTRGELTAITQYSICLFLRRDAVAGVGTLTIDLVDELFNVIQDEVGIPNSFDIDLSTLTETYLPYTGVFRTPLSLPETQYIRIRQSIAYTSTRAFYLDRVSFGQMSQMYTSGPYISCHSGKAAFEAGDYATCVVTNTRGSGGTLNTWQTLLFRLFPSEVLNNELIFPSSTVPSISDNLIG